MAVPLIPWEPHVFPKEIQDELRRRSTNRGMSPTAFSSTNWKKNDDDWNQYKGPMTAWVRVCSNGYGSEQVKPAKPGFVFYGGKDFYQSYGFQESIGTNRQASAPNRSIIGYTPEGIPHFIENDIISSDYPIHVPSPEIEKVSVTINKELLRRVRIEWTCFSSAQLEYMSPYFLIPGISVIVEWGWNHFNPLSLLRLDDRRKLAELYNNPYPLYTKNVLDSKGNYEVVFGIVTNFEWSIDGNKIKCMTEVTSKDRLYAGQLVNENMIEQDAAITKNAKDVGVEGKIRVFDNLKKFVKTHLDQFKNLVEANKDVDAAIEASRAVNHPTNPLYFFLKYVKQTHPDNYKDYILGLFYGRDEKTTVNRNAINLSRAAATAGGGSVSIPVSTASSSDIYADTDNDFDCQSNRTSFWINMGLIVEIINFFSSELKGVKDEPMFRVDVDDCVIGGHPNLISTDGDILLIPNALAPKYFAGSMGDAATSATGKPGNEYRDLMLPCSLSTKAPKASDLDPNEIQPSLKWADYRLRRIVLPLIPNGIARDDINFLINMARFERGTVKGKYEFPFITDYYQTEKGVQRKYEALYTGFFKNLYLNSKAFQEIFENGEVKRFSDVYDEIFKMLNKASSDFWDLKLMGSTGRESTTGLATMKIVDNKVTQYTSNDGEEIFTFDYYAADGLLQSINFRPMLSNAQAIRTIYAQTNLTNKRSVVVSGQNELLDYKFRDRLFLENDQSDNQKDPEVMDRNTFKDSMAKLQALYPPPNKSFQMTTKAGVRQKTIFRLAIPKENAEVLTLLLDDNDQNHNPRYTGIMPGIQAEFQIQGLAGLRTFGMFRVRGLPEPYSEDNIVFRIINVNDTIQNGQWVTNIVAGVIPLRGYFRSKLRLPTKAAAKGQ